MELVSGKALMQAAGKGIKNMKKEWVFAQEYQDEAGNQKISMDNSMEAVVNKVLDHIWVASKGNFYDTPKKYRCVENKVTRLKQSWKEKMMLMIRKTRTIKAEINSQTLVNLIGCLLNM